MRIAGEHLRFSKDQDPNLGMCGDNKCMVTEEPGTSHCPPICAYILAYLGTFHECGKFCNFQQIKDSEMGI